MSGYRYVTRQADRRLTGSHNDFFVRNILVSSCGCGWCGDCTGTADRVTVAREAFGDLCDWPGYDDVAQWATSEGVAGAMGVDATINPEALALSLDATITKICRDCKGLTRYEVDVTTGEVVLDGDGLKQQSKVPADVRLATIMMATRLYRRRLSPDGTLGSSAFGGAIRVSRYDPDIAALLEPYLRAGIA